MSRENIIEICRVLAEQENLQVTVKESGKGALIAGLGVFVGGIVAGPIGMAVGGSVTSIAVALSAQGKFKSVVEIIAEMNDDQKRRLAQSVEKAIQNIRPEDYVRLLTLALSDTSLKEAIIIEIRNFMMDEFQMRMIGLN